LIEGYFEISMNDIVAMEVIYALEGLDEETKGFRL
jgi:hypothetical protein